MSDPSGAWANRDHNAHIKQVLLAIRNVNQLIVHETDPQQLLDHVCITLTETMGYFSAWIALMGKTGTTVKMTACAGFESSLPNLQTLLNNDRFPECMVDALSSDEIVVADHPQTQCPNCPHSAHYGGHVAMTRRLIFQDHVYGVLSVSVPPSFAQESEEQQLFVELTNDLAYALRKLEDAKALQRERDLTERVMSTSPTGIVLVNAEGQIHYANPQAEQILGLAFSHIVGRTYDDPEWKITDWSRGDFPADHLPFAVVKRTGQPVWGIEHAIEWPDGRRVLLSVNAAPLFDANGLFEGMVSTLEDITERQRSELSLRESERRYRTLFRDAPVGIFTTLSTGTPISVNPEMARILGFSSPKEALERYSDIATELYVHPEQREEFLRQLNRNGSVDGFEYQARTADGRNIWLSMDACIRNRFDDGTFLITGFTTDITERKKAEHAYSRLCDMATELICVADINTATFLQINPAFEKVLGYSQDELLNRSFLDFVHPEDVERTMEVVRDKLQAGETVISFENRYRCKNGSYRNLEWNSHPVLAEGVTYAIAHDITERKQAEQLLRENEAFTHAVLDHLPVGIAVNTINPTVNFAYMNDNFPKFYRTTRDAISDPDTFWAAVYEDPAYRETIKKRILEDCASNDPKRMYWRDVPISRQGEETRYITARNTPVPDRQMMVSTVWDVTERKRAEEALRRSEQQYRGLFASMMEGFAVHELILDAHGAPGDYRFLAINPAFERLTGLRPSEVVGRTVRESMPQTETEWIETYGKVVKTGEPIEFENYAQELNRWFHVTAFRNAPNQFATIFEDITERKQAEEERCRLETQLRQSQKMEAVGRLAGGVAHDFNNMLQTILGYSDILLDETDTSHPFHEHLVEIRKAAQRSADLTRQLLAFARKQTIAPKILDLNEIVTGMLKMLNRLIGEDIDLLWKPSTDIWPIQMDPAQVNQILANLVVNARDAIVGVGKITIETNRVEFDDNYCVTHMDFLPGQYTMLAVSDNGMGMEQEILSQIFEPFFTTKQSDQGTGLGLATVYGIVKQNSGFINIYSEPKQGTTVRIYLPGVHSGCVSPEKKPISSRPKTGNETVLLVEDEESLLKLSQHILEQLGYSVLVAGGPEKALQVAQEYPGEIHLLITDVVMPQMSGRDLWTQLNEVRPTMRSLFMSGYTANVIAHHGVLDKGVHFLQKPFSAEALAFKIRDILEEE